MTNTQFKKISLRNIKDSKKYKAFEVEKDFRKGKQN